MAKVKARSVQMPSARSEDQPATRKMLSLVRDELSQKMESGFNSIRSEIHAQRADFQRLEAGNSRMQLLFEEQNANNRIVLEGLQALWQRQDRTDQRFR